MESQIDLTGKFNRALMPLRDTCLGLDLAILCFLFQILRQFTNRSKSSPCNANWCPLPRHMQSRCPKTSLCLRRQTPLHDLHHHLLRLPIPLRHRIRLQNRTGNSGHHVCFIWNVQHRDSVCVLELLPKAKGNGDRDSS